MANKNAKEIILEDFDYTVPEMVKNYLWRDKNITFAGYSKQHLQDNKIVMYIRAKDDVDKILKNTISVLKKDISSLLKAVK